MAELKFTGPQFDAITDHRGAVLVSAAAGSGKTRVLVERLLRQVLDPIHPRDIDEFLVITFTKKAASELRSRIGKSLTAELAAQSHNRHLARQLTRLSRAQITTIDGFCSELVREHAFELHASPDFRQIEAKEAERLRTEVAETLLDTCYERIAEDTEFRLLVDTLGAGRGDGEVETALQRVYNSAQCHLYPDAWLQQCIDALELSQYADAGQTPWGKALIEDFSRLCAGKITILRAARSRCAAETLLETRYAPVLEHEIAQLEALSKLESWDELHAAQAVFEKMPTIRATEKTELSEQVKRLRDECKTALQKKLKPFQNQDSAAVMADLGQTGQALTALFRLVRRFSQAYAREKNRLRVMDFADLEHGAVQLLLHPDGTPRQLAIELSAQYAEIMLDEYQDTNEVQDRLFRALSREGKNRFMVGDVKQAIYRFRLADPSIFLDKYGRYAPIETAADGAPRKILLSENFRSDRGILDAANAVFSACMSRDVGGLDYGSAERLRPGKVRVELPGPVTELHCINTKPSGSTQSAPDKDAVEADFAARRIRRLLDEGTLIAGENDTLRPVRPEDIVILLRTTSSTAPYYIAALAAQGIPCAAEREGNLLDAPEIETLLSFLRVIDNPRQDIPLAATLLSPPVGMTADTLAQIRALHRDGSLYDALTVSDHPEAAAFLQTLSDLRAQARQLALDELLTVLIERTGIEEIYGVLPDGEMRLSRIHRLFALASGYAEGGKKSLPQFLTDVETLPPEQSESGATPPGTVRLMSIHKSKGLEFPVVVLAGLSHRFNTDDYKRQVLLHPKLGAGCNVYDAAGRYRYHSIAKRAIIARGKAEDLAEELRVLYVAMTRPMDRLIMIYCGGSLDGRVQTIAQRLTLPPEPLLAAEAKCPGDWVLEAALLRTEAGELFAAGEKPMQTQVSEIPWLIRYHEITELPKRQALLPRQAKEQPAPFDPAVLDAPSFRYPYAAAVTIPAKATATQLKGRQLDEEVADGRPTRPARPLRRPVFDGTKPLSPTERGTATHLAMQYLDFAKTGSVDEIQAELERLVREEYLTPRQAEAVSPEQIFRIFAGEIGARIAKADRVIREFKFSLMTDAALFDPAGEGEKMLLQGVTDCCLMQDGALTVIDFKTDRVLPGQEQAAAERYRVQLEAYSMALGRIFGCPVREKLLYFFRTDTAVAL